MIKLYHPDDNLNCPGLSIGEWFYIDIFPDTFGRLKWLGIFVKIGQWRCRIYHDGKIRSRYL